MRDRQRKKAQTKINKNVRAMNKNLFEDNLWKGRFYVHQIDARWHRFSDGSGGILTAWLEVKDSYTGDYEQFAVDNYDIYGCHLWNAVNTFVCNQTARRDIWENIMQ